MLFSPLNSHLNPLVVYWTGLSIQTLSAVPRYWPEVDETRRAAFAVHTAEQRQLREERAAAYREECRPTRLNPLCTLVAIGLALVVRSVVTLVVGDYSFTGRKLAVFATALVIESVAIQIGSLVVDSSGSRSTALADDNTVF